MLRELVRSTSACRKLCVNEEDWTRSPDSTLRACTAQSVDPWAPRVSQRSLATSLTAHFYYLDLLGFKPMASRTYSRLSPVPSESEESEHQRPYSMASQGNFDDGDSFLEKCAVCTESNAKLLEENPLRDRASQHSHESAATVVGGVGLQQYYHGGGADQQKRYDFQIILCHSADRLPQPAVRMRIHLVTARPPPSNSGPQRATHIPRS